MKTLDKKREVFFNQFENWVLEDIKILLGLKQIGNSEEFLPDRSKKDYHRPFSSAVLLTCCAIDILAGFRYGRKKDNSGEHFNDFIKEYFVSSKTRSKKSYDNEKVYNGLRNKLTHGYSLGADVALIHTDENKHLVEDRGFILFDVYSFLYDLESVYRLYKQDLKEGKYLEEFEKRWDFSPMIEYIEDDGVKRPIFDN